jgi:hypothetical protein
MTGVARVAAPRCIRELDKTDTICIDKSNNNELSEAINSMFRWYRDAVKCYVYLSDVSQPALGVNDAFNHRTRESDFRKSRWFTRGWTLQELLAPRSVEFFSREGNRLVPAALMSRHSCSRSRQQRRTLLLTSPLTYLRRLRVCGMGISERPPLNNSAEVPR